MIYSVISWFIGFLLLNEFLWMIQSPMRFGWYNKNDEDRGREVLEELLERKP